MKKILLALVTAMVFGCGWNIAPSYAEANDVWVYSDYPTDVYVRDESVNWKNEYKVTATVIWLDVNYKTSRKFTNVYAYVNGAWRYHDVNGSMRWINVDGNAVQESVVNHLLELR